MFSLARSLLLGALLALSGCASEDPDMSARFDELERFKIFRSHLIEAGRKMSVIAKDGAIGKGILAPIRDESLTFARPLELVKAPSLVIEGMEEIEATPQYLLHISPDFLTRATDEYLKYSAAHEVCHIKLGHFHLKTNEPGHEVEANQCACAYVRKAVCLNAHRYQARITGERKITALSEAELERYLVKLYGSAVFEKP